MRKQNDFLLLSQMIKPQLVDKLHKKCLKLPLIISLHNFFEALPPKLILYLTFESVGCIRLQLGRVNPFILAESIEFRQLLATLLSDCMGEGRIGWVIKLFLKF